MTKHQRSFLIGLAASVILLFSLLASLIAAQPLKQDNNATATALSLATMTALGTAAPNEATVDHKLTATAASMTMTRTADERLATQSAGTSPLEPVLTLAHDAPMDGVITMGARIVSWDEAGKIKLWDAASGDLLLELDHGYPLDSTNLGVPLKSVQVNASGTRLLAWNNAISTCACDLHAHIWDIDPESATYGQVLVSVSQLDPTDFAAGGGAMWSPDETLLITWSRDGSAHLWDATSGAELAILRHSSIIWGAAWKNDSSRLITWSTDRSAEVWNIPDVIDRTAASPREFRNGADRFLHRNLVWGALWSPDERLILTWSFDKNAALWDANSGQLIAILPHKNYVWSAIWDGDRVITSAFDGAVRVWDMKAVNPEIIGQTLHPALEIRQDGTAFTRTRLNPNGKTAVSSGVGGSTVWSLETGGIYFNIPLKVTSMDWYPGSGDYLLTTSDAGAAQIWGGFSGERIATLVQDTPILGAIWLSAETAPQVITWNEGGQVTLWRGKLAETSAASQLPTPVPTRDPRPPSAAPATGTIEAATATAMQATAYAVQTATTAKQISFARIDASYPLLQSFVAQPQIVTSVDLRLQAWQGQVQHGEVVTISITDVEQKPLAQVEQFVPAGFDGWLRIVFPESVLVTPGKSYILRVGATFGTTRDPYLSWEVDYSNPYPDGTGGSGTTFFPGYDYVYRLNSEDAAASLPKVTVTPTITPTPIPPPATATVEAAWYRAGIYANANPRTAWLLQVPVGGSLNLFLGYEECCYFVQEVPGMQLTWTVEPAGSAQIDPETGVLKVDDTADAAPLTVIVTNANGLSKSVVVSVYDPEMNPLVGIWREEARLDCQTGAFKADRARIAEFILTADGRLRVSWEEFEVYVDYVGTYTFDLASGALHLSGQYLNYLPPDFKGEGRFSIDEQGRLILRDIWLGTAPYGDDTPACGHRFVRQ